MDAEPVTPDAFLDLPTPGYPRDFRPLRSHPPGLRPTGFDPIPTPTSSFSSLRAWDAPLADTSSIALRFSGTVRFYTSYTAPEGIEAPVSRRPANPPDWSPRLRRTEASDRPSSRIPGRREPE